jgi:large subunit ribosomal protein L31
MKTDIHPQDYRKVIFHDNASNEDFLISSTMPSQETKKWSDGEEYPVVYVEISSASHPFYTGTEKRLDSAGRAEKFMKRASQAKK